jgi:hypothetical protein
VSRFDGDDDGMCSDVPMKPMKRSMYFSKEADDDEMCG